VSEQGGPPAEGGVEPDAPATGPAPADDAEYRRPQGWTGSFAPPTSPPAYRPPPPTVPPALREAYGRPPGAGAYNAGPGDRVPPRVTAKATVPWQLAGAFGPGPDAQGGFAPEPGTRIAPHGRAPESAWWKADALRDPWRDPAAPFWLGRGAVYEDGSPAQLDPAQDVLHDDEFEVVEEAEPVAAAASGRARFGLRAIVLSLVIALVAGAIGGFGGYWLAGRANDVLHRSDVSLSQVSPATIRPPGSVASIVKRVGPAVVSLDVTSADKSRNGVGSGVVIDKLGYVLTNDHVAEVAKGGGTIVATFSDEGTAKAQIVGLDPISDLAVLKVPDQTLTVATLGTSSKLAVGDPVIAIGSPLGLVGTVTSGIVSALNRPVHTSSESGGSGAYLDAIQTDAAINPGNSGGALVDAHGAVVGINSAARLLTSDGANGTLPVSGIGYAIPIDYARDIADQLIKTGKAVHGSLDAQGRTAQAGLQEGAYLEQVVPKGAAAKAGLKNGDVIIVADGKPIVSYDELVVTVQEHKPGATIDLTYYRGAAKKTTTVTLSPA
jgi:S1-C subfamily serine protease